MIAEQCNRMDKAVKEAIDDLDKSHLRKTQYNMHICAAKCCQDETASSDNTQRCVNDCTLPLKHARDYMQHEITEFQGGLKRCVTQCHSDIKILMSPHPTDSETAKSTEKFESCAVTCIDKYIGLIPNMMRTMREVLKNGAKPQI